MKSVDLNFIRYENLLNDSLYNYIYKKSKEYECFLPTGMKLGNCYLVNFYNYDLSVRTGKFSPNLSTHLNILVGCRRYNFSGVVNKEESSLYLYFHSINLCHNYSQSFINVVLNNYNASTHCYKKFPALILNYTNIDAYKEDFTVLLNDYINSNQIFSKLVPAKNIEEVYIDKDVIEVPF